MGERGSPEQKAETARAKAQRPLSFYVPVTLKRDEVASLTTEVGKKGRQSEEEDEQREKRQSLKTLGRKKEEELERKQGSHKITRGSRRQRGGCNVYKKDRS